MDAGLVVEMVSDFSVQFCTVWISRISIHYYLRTILFSAICYNNRKTSGHSQY